MLVESANTLYLAIQVTLLEYLKKPNTGLQGGGVFFEMKIGLGIHTNILKEDVIPERASNECSNVFAWIYNMFRYCMKQGYWKYLIYNGYLELPFQIYEDTENKKLKLFVINLETGKRFKHMITFVGSNEVKEEREELKVLYKRNILQNKIFGGVYGEPIFEAEFRKLGIWRKNGILTVVINEDRFKIPGKVLSEAILNNNKVDLEDGETFEKILLLKLVLEGFGLNDISLFNE